MKNKVFHVIGNDGHVSELFRAFPTKKEAVAFIPKLKKVFAKRWLFEIKEVKCWK